MLLHERLPLDAHYVMVTKFAVTFFPVLTCAGYLGYPFEK